MTPLSGLAGDDKLYGEAGDDVLNGGAGNDILDGGAGVDTASYAGAAAGVTVNLSLLTAQNTGGAGTDTLLGIENLTGSSFNDTLTGNAGANTLDGGAGNDVLYGGDGDDRMIGGAGNDWFISQAGNDTMDGGDGIDSIDLGSTRPATVDLKAGFLAVNGTTERDTLVSIENINASSYDDVLIGSDGANTISAWGGNDVITGNKGDDRLQGGWGADRFIYKSGDGLDTITDFSVADKDVIVLDAASFGIAAGSKVADWLALGNAATKADHGYFVANASGVWWDADGSGAGAATQIFKFENATTAAGISDASFVFG